MSDKQMVYLCKIWQRRISLHANKVGRKKHGQCVQTPPQKNIIPNFVVLDSSLFCYFHMQFMSKFCYIKKKVSSLQLLLADTVRGSCPGWSQSPWTKLLLLSLLSTACCQHSLLLKCQSNHIILLMKLFQWLSIAVASKCQKPLKWLSRPSVSISQWRCKAMKLSFCKFLQGVFAMTMSGILLHLGSRAWLRND